MLEPFYLSKKRQSDLTQLFQYIKDKRDPDFYLTKDNKRLYINDVKTLKKLLQSSIVTIVLSDDNVEYCGIALIWKSTGGNIKRYYVKIIANSPKIADKLITVLSWHFKKELYIKIRKDSHLIPALKSKGFRFEGGRGKQILLKRGIIPVRLDRRKEYVHKSQ